MSALSGLIATFAGGTLSFSDGHTNSSSLLNSTCRCLVGGFTSRDNGDGKRFCAPNRIDHIVTGIVNVRRSLRRGVSVCSPAYNSNSLLLETLDRSLRPGGATLFNRRGSVGGINVTGVGVVLRNCRYDSVRRNSALGGPRFLDSPATLRAFGCIMTGPPFDRGS